MKARASEESTLAAWDELSLAIKRAECALPNQMTEAMRDLVIQSRRFDDLMLGRVRAPETPRNRVEPA